MANPIAYQGAELISFTVNLLPPLTRIYVFANGVDITFTSTPESGIIGQPLVTDNAGSLKGKILLPATGIYKFPAGDVTLVFCENISGPSKSTYTAEVKLFNSMVVPSSVASTDAGVVSTTPPTQLTQSNQSTVSVTSADSLLVQNSTEAYPLTQSFYVDANKNPFGIVITSLEICILEKDLELPIGIEFRGFFSGAPDTTKFITGTSVFKKPAEITTGTASNPVFTKFNIMPTFLLPGQYAFSILTNSSKYKIATAKLGSLDSAGRIITNQPFLGSLYKTQSSGAWEPDYNEQISFKINKAKFETGIKTFEFHSPEILGYTTDSATFKTKDITFGEASTIIYRLKIRKEDGTYTNYTTIRPDQITRFSEDYLIKNKSDCIIQVEFNNKSTDVTPVVDLEQTRLLSIKHLSFAWEPDVSDSELDASNLGFARSRYVSRIVNLLSGFDSTGLEVKLDVNRVTGSDIEVLCRVLSPDDTGEDANIENQPFKRMTLVSPRLKSFAGNDDTAFSTEIYKILEPKLAYTRVTLVNGIADVKEFKTFNKFQIKIVFYASIPGLVAKIKNLIATSVI
ncbi:MAG: hypothetical protein EBU90_07605 [Proteobacteria bacterium]|nr:hypothetical protein [Pseudomonadota bacterium]NBP13433.1 hypothetical protein [bacterium]